MMPHRLPFAVALLFALGPFLFAPTSAAPPKAPSQFTGKVVPLKDLLEKGGSRLDRDAAPFWLALVADDGKVHPIIKDDGGRRFFKDARLQNRPVQITGRLFGDTGLLQVVSVHGLKDGKPTELYYWCDICAIKRHELMTCECCGGPMELKEEPVGR